MKMSHLLKVQAALTSADAELQVRGDELRRLQDVEQIPLSVSVTAKAEREVREALVVVGAAIDEAEKRAEIADKGERQQA